MGSQAVQMLFEYVQNLLNNTSAARVDVAALPAELHDLGASLEQLGEVFVEQRKLAHELVASKALLEEEKLTSSLLQESLLQANSLFEEITSSTEAWIVICEKHSGDWLFSNKSPQHVLGYPTAEKALITWMNSQVHACLHELGETGKRSCHRELGPEDLGLQRYFAVSVFPANWHGREAVAFILDDRTEAQHILDELEELAYHDELTGTWSRLRGMELLVAIIEEKTPFALCFIDLDDLKYINDVYGHNLGDDYILTVSRELEEFDAEAIVSRLGGDEFMLIARGWNCADSNKRLENIRERLITNSKHALASTVPQGKTRTASNPKLRYYSISYGVVEVGIDNTLSASHLLAQADEHMYEYKKARKIERRTE